jgi:hypothetical protein
MANGTTYLTRTLSSGTNNTKGTFSFWVKRGDAEATIFQGIFGGRKNSSNDGNIFQILLQNNNNGAGVQCAFWNSSGTNLGNKRTSNAMRDLSAWYHVVCTIDTTLATADDRIKIYVNGERITNLAGSPNTNPSQNDTFAFFNNYSNHQQMVGGFYATSSTAEQGKLNGILSHVHACDGYAYDASAFGETDSTTGEWKIKTNPSVTYGNNGFFILKDGNSVTDQSGNSNNFTVAGGTLTKTEDNPSNVFATLNPLSSVGTFSYGNTEVEYGSGTGYQTTTTTLGMTSGKYYCEAKITFDGNYPGFGIAATNSLQATVLGNDWLGEHSDSYGYFLDGVIYSGGSTVSSGLSTFATNDVMGMALDLDSAQNTLKFYKNGSLVTTVNIPDNSNGWMFGVTHLNTKTSARSKFNFGNGYFRSTAVSSAGTNASNNGIFEYDVPAGYTALSTKGLNL